MHHLKIGVFMYCMYVQSWLCGLYEIKLWNDIKETLSDALMYTLSIEANGLQYQPQL